MNFAKKSLGQNFLIDKNIIKKILNLVSIKNKNIIEIGPGRGALTEEILNHQPKTLILVEKDYHLANKLIEKYKNNKIIKIFNTDILKFDIEKFTKLNTNIFGNLPYNISSQILVKILKYKNWPPKFDNLIFMFQKELGEKIISSYPSKNYGRLSIISNYRLNVIRKFLISPNSFFPKPKVNSMVVHFQPKKSDLLDINKILKLEKITNILFSNKRKMINKNIQKILTLNEINSISDLKMNLRPSEIKPEIYYKIAELFKIN